MPKPQIHLVEQTAFVGIISCTKCGYECVWISKNYNNGKCKRCGKDTRNLITACSSMSTRPLGQTIKSYIRNSKGTL